MKQSERDRLLLIESCMDNADVPKGAKTDVRRRLETTFVEHDVVEEWEIMDELRTLKTDKNSQFLWGQPVSQQQPKEKPFDWNSITNPAERMTRFRESQAAQGKERRG